MRPRASSSPATLTHAISSTQAAAASRTSADCRTIGSTRASRSGTAVALQTMCGSIELPVNPGPIAASSALACVRLTPSFSRAIALMKFCDVVMYSE